MTPPTDLTTKQLGEAIAQAVVSAWTELDINKGDEDPSLTDAVFRVLEEHGCWFCRLRETPQGTHVEQLELWP